SRQWPAPPSWQRRSVRTSTWPRTRAGPIRADLGAASRSRLAESTAIAAIGWQRILLRPARVSAGRVRFCDSAEAISARAVVGGASGAWSLSRKASGRRVRAKTIVAIAGDRWFESSSLLQRVISKLGSDVRTWDLDRVTVELGLARRAF